MDGGIIIQDIKQELETLIKARYPLIMLETSEESRAVRLIASIAVQQNKTFLAWAVTTGLCKPTDTTKWQKVAEGTEDPLNALDYVNNSTEPIIAIFKDFHKFMNDIMPVRKLRDLHEALKETRNTVIITTPVVSIPQEMQKEITVISLPLPTEDDLWQTLQETLSGVETGAKGNRKTGQILSGIDKMLKENGNKEAILKAGLGLTLNEFENVLSKSIVATETLDTSVIIAEKEQIIRKSQILEFYTSLADMQDVGGLKTLKQWIEQRKHAFSDKARKFGLHQPKGVLLIGSPGTGKSLMAKVIGKHMGMPLLRLDMSKIFSGIVGSSEQNITAALKVADATAPAVLWLDEVEKAMAGVQSSGQLDSGVTARIFGIFLTWMQEHESAVFICMTSNNPTQLPPEFMRAGRFDAIFHVNLPNVPERKEIFEIHLHKVHRNIEDFNTEAFAGMTDGFSGAEIEAVIQDALHAVYFKGEELTDEAIKAAIKATKPLSKKRESELKALQDWAKENALNASEESQDSERRGRRIEL